MGRPSDYTPELAALICNRIQCGEGMAQICRTEGMPVERTVYRWLETRPEFQQMYARAREIQADYFVDEIIEISDDSRNDWMKREGELVTDHEHVNRSRLRVDSRKWAAAKLAPRKYGDKLAVGGDADNPLKVYHRVAYVIVDPKEPGEG